MFKKQTDLFAVDKQGEAVEQAVDGVARLVDGEDDGATVVCHPAETKEKNTQNILVFANFNLQNESLGNKHKLQTNIMLENKQFFK